MYSARPAEFVSQIPASPVAVFKANAEPEALELGAAEDVGVVVGPVVFVAAADVLEELLQVPPVSPQRRVGRRNQAFAVKFYGA
jgi:hypothetical protein